MKSVGIFFGSRSPEHDISIITAMRVVEGFAKLSQYRAVPVYIDKKGRWHFGEALGNLGFFRNPHYELLLEDYSLSALHWENGKLLLAGKKHGLFSSASSEIIDIAFPCFHGSFGEDGTIQGLFEMADVPYVGCGVRASALAMSKIHARRLLDSIGIPGVSTIEVFKKQFQENRASVFGAVKKTLQFPVFIKPNALGSSIAISRASNEKELEWGIELALEFDQRVLVEQGIRDPKEVNVAVAGHRELIVSETEAPQFKSAFQTFEEKYVTKGGTISQAHAGKGERKSRIPADIPKELGDQLKQTARKAFRGIDASGIARFDFMIDQETGDWYLGEINTLPGTLQAHLWEASGVPFPELIKKLIASAEERYEEEKSSVRVFSSSVLQK